MMNFSFPLPSCYQLGFVAASIDEYAPILKTIFSIRKFHLFPDITFAEVLYDGKPSPCSVHVAIGWCGDTQIEIVQPLYGKGVHADFLETNPSGLHHIGLLADDFPAEVMRMTQIAGLPVQQGIIGNGRGIEFSYFDTKKNLGVMTEVIHLSDSVAQMYDRLKLRANR